MAIMIKVNRWFALAIREFPIVCSLAKAKATGFDGFLFLITDGKPRPGAAFDQ